MPGKRYRRPIVWKMGEGIGTDLAITLSGLLARVFGLCRGPHEDGRVGLAPLTRKEELSE